MSMNSSKQPVFPAAGLIANTTCQTQNRLSVFFSIIFMTVGILSNSLAIAILMKAYQRFRQKSKASFLLLASGLVITDFFGHLINGGIAVFVYASDKDWIRFDQSNILCSVFGISMVFSGLCPLFLGSVMAIERCIGVTNPIFHSTKITSKHVKMILGGVCMFAIFVALLPILGHRDYQIQASRTWCFYNTEHIEDWEDRFYLLFFSFLGLLALGVSFLCNAITGVTLLRVKFKSQQHRQGRSHHFEMVIQLLAIMCVSCICWSPFLDCCPFPLSQLLSVLNDSESVEDEHHSQVPGRIYDSRIPLLYRYPTHTPGSSVQKKEHSKWDGASTVRAMQVTMANIAINGNNSPVTCETTLFALRMATWNQILDPWVYILLRKAVLKNLYKLASHCCGVHIISLHIWELSSIKNSLKVAAISESPAAEKESQQASSEAGL